MNKKMSFGKFSFIIIVLTLICAVASSSVQANITFNNIYNSTNVSIFNATFNQTNGANFFMNTTNGTIIPSVNVSQGMVARYLLNDTCTNNSANCFLDSVTGTYANGSGYVQNTGTVTNVTFNSSGANFNGITSFIRSPITSATNISSSNSFTITTNIFVNNYNTTPGYEEGIIAFTPTALRGIGLQVHANGSILYGMRNSTAGNYLYVPFNINEFFSISATYDTLRNEMKLYKNGVYIGNATGVSTLSPTDFVIGSTIITGTHLSFNGSISSIQIFNRSLNATEVGQLYNCTSGNNKYSCISDGLVFQNVYTDNTTYNATNVKDVNYLVQSPNPNGANTYVYRSTASTGTRFDGVNNRIILNSSSIFIPENNFTVSSWIKYNEITSSGTCIIQNTYGGNRFSISKNGNQIKIGLYNGSLWVSKIHNLVSSEYTSWNKVDVVYTSNYNFNNESISLYVNGILYNTSSSPSSSGVVGFNIGSCSNGASNFNGSISDVTIWNRSLTDAEVQQWYLETSKNYNITAKSDTFFTQSVSNLDINNNYQFNSSQAIVRFQTNRKVDNVKIPANYTIGSTTKANNTEFYLDAGAYVVNVSSTGYKNYSVNQVVSVAENDTVNINGLTNANLTINLYDLYSLTNLIGFNVTISNSLYSYSETNITTGSLAYFELVDGTYNYTLSKSGYFTKSGQITIVAGANSLQVNSSQAIVKLQARELATSNFINANFTILPTNYVQGCYQEFANVSTACGGLSTGTYSFTNALNDGDWNTNLISTTDYYYMNYTKPLFATSAIWQVKDAGALTNITIPASCFAQQPIQVRTHLDEAVDDTWWDCYNGTTWINLRTYSTNNDAYEEAIFWYYDNTKANNTEFYLDVNNYSVYTSSAGYFNKTDLITVTSLQNDTQTIYNMSNAQLNLTLYNTITNTSLNNASVSVKYANGVIQNYTGNGTKIIIYGNINSALNISSTGQNGLADFSFIYTPSTTYQNYTYSGYTTNSIYFITKDEATGNYITSNITLSFYSTNSSVYTFTLNNGSGYVSNITPTIYSVTASNVDYLPRTTQVTVGNNSFQTVVIYLGNTSSSTIVSILDAITNKLLEGVLVTIETPINSSWEIVDTTYTDTTGRIGFGYNSGQAYRFTFSKSGYVSRTDVFNPILLSAMVIRLTPDSANTNLPLQNIDIHVTNKNFTNNQVNNVSVLFSSPYGVFTSYGFLAYVSTSPTTQYNTTGTNANGETLIVPINISNAPMGASLIINTTYTDSYGNTYYFTNNYEILSGNISTWTFQKNTDNTYGLSLFDRIIIWLISVGIGASITYATAGGSATGLVALVITGFFVATGMLPIAVVIISMIGFFILSGGGNK